MAVAFDAFQSNSGTFANSFTFTPVGTPRAIIVLIPVADAAVTAVTYGGVSMTQITGSPATGGGGSNGWFLGASVPTGAQTVAITGPTANGVLAQVYSLTAGGNVEEIDTVIWNNTTGADPTGTLSLGGRTCFAALSAESGQDDPANVAPLSGWTAREEVDVGAFVEIGYSYNTIGSSDITAGWTQTSDTYNGVAVAVSEVSGGGSVRPPMYYPRKMFFPV